MAMAGPGMMWWLARSTSALRWCSSDRQQFRDLGRADVVALYRAKIAHEPSAWTNSAETLHAE